MKIHLCNTFLNVLVNTNKTIELIRLLVTGKKNILYNIAFECKSLSKKNI